MNDGKTQTPDEQETIQATVLCDGKAAPAQHQTEAATRRNSALEQVWYTGPQGELVLGFRHCGRWCFAVLFTPQRMEK